MRKALGLLGLLLVLVLITVVWERQIYDASRFLTLVNARNQLTWIGLFGFLALAQALVIITGGIDLSVGSVVALVGISSAMLMERGDGLAPVLAVALVLLMAAGIGLSHGLLITKARIQPFIVTLCGLFIYRGIARFITEDTTQGFGISLDSLRLFGNGTVGDLLPGSNGALEMLPLPFLLMLLLAAVLAAFLHFTPSGRHLFALGANEEAARFSGLQTDRLKIAAYVLCSLITALGALLFAFKVNSMGPSDFGNFYELYAIAGAVLGGCSLRGGTGNVLGVVLGIALIQVLRNMVNLLQIRSELEYVVIGGTILTGVVVDEILTRRAAARRARLAQG